MVNLATMAAATDHLKAYFKSLTDNELLDRYSSELTDEARYLVKAEACIRSLNLTSPAPSSDQPEATSDSTGDLVIVAHNLTTTGAVVLADYLGSQGIRAFATDANVATAFGGVIEGANVRVPESEKELAGRLAADFECRARDCEATTSDEADPNPAPTNDPSSCASKHRLRTYRRYIHPQRNAAVIVKEGFSWGALIFGPLWFLLHRMWFMSLVSLALTVGGHAFFSAHRSPESLMCIFVAYWAIWIFIGRIANDFLCTSLRTRGYRLQAVVRARSVTDVRYPPTTG